MDHFILQIFSELLSSVQFSHSVMSDSLRPHELQHTRPPCPSPTPRVHPNSCPSSRWCHLAISSSVIPFSSCPQSLPASGSFPMSQLFAWGGQSIGVSASASILPMNTQDWSPLGWTAAAAAAVKSLQSCLTLRPIDGSPPGFPSLGFSRQEHRNGLPFPSPMHESEKWKWSCSVVSDSSDPINCSLPGSSIHGIF